MRRRAPMSIPEGILALFGHARIVAINAMNGWLQPWWRHGESRIDLCVDLLPLGFEVEAERFTGGIQVRCRHPARRARVRPVRGGWGGPRSPAVRPLRRRSG